MHLEEQIIKHSLTEALLTSHHNRKAMAEKPKANSSLAQKELDKAEAQFQEFDNQVKEMTLDRMNAAPKLDVDQQTKLSQKDIEKSKDIYLKPSRSIASKERFNETYRDDYNFAKEYVQFIAENKEIIGEEIDLWTKPYPGMPAEEWKIPVNKPVWGPRYLAEQIKRASYHRLMMVENRVTGMDGMGQYYGSMAADSIIQRLDAIPVSQRKSIFMGSGAF
jgi:hypothetical protein